MHNDRCRQTRLDVKSVEAFGSLIFFILFLSFEYNRAEAECLCNVRCAVQLYDHRKTIPNDYIVAYILFLLAMGSS